MVIQHHFVRVFSPAFYLQIAKRYWILDGNKSFYAKEKKNCVRSCEILHISMIKKNVSILNLHSLQYCKSQNGEQC